MTEVDATPLRIPAFYNNQQKILHLTFVPVLEVKVTCNVGQYPLHIMTYAPAKFVVATFNGLGGYAFTRKYIYLTFDLVTT